MSVRKLVVSLRNAKIKAREVQKSGVYMSVLEHFLGERNADIGVFLETLIIGITRTDIGYLHQRNIRRIILYQNKKPRSCYENFCNLVSQEELRTSQHAEYYEFSYRH